jgi:hypothetical protein
VQGNATPPLTFGSKCKCPTTSNAETQIIVLRDDIREAQEEENSYVVGAYYTILVFDFLPKT